MWGKKSHEVTETPEVIFLSVVLEVLSSWF